MRRDTKLGYGFLLAGAGLPYLFDKLLGSEAGIVSAAICLTVGILFLFSGHLHREAELEPQMGITGTIVSFVVVGALIGGVIGAVCVLWQKRHPVDVAQTKKEIVQPKPRSETKHPPFPEFLFNAALESDGSIGITVVNPSEEPIDDVAISILRSPTPAELNDHRDDIGQWLASRTQQVNVGILRPQLATPIGKLRPQVMPPISAKTQYQISIYTRHEAFTQHSYVILHTNGFVQQSSQLFSNKTQEKLFEVPNKELTQREATSRKESVLKNAAEAKQFLVEQQRLLPGHPRAERSRLEKHVVEEFIQSYGYRTNWALDELAQRDVDVEAEMQWISQRRNLASLIALVQRIEDPGSKLP